MSGPAPKPADRTNRAIFLNRYFYPDHSATSQMLSDLAIGLAGRGFAVSVITSRQRYEDAGAGLPARERIAGVQVHRVWSAHFGRRNLIGRAFDYLTFYMSAALCLWRLARTGDIIIAKTDPPMLSVLAAPIARWRGARLVNWLQDIFPEVAEQLGAGRRIPRPILSVLRTLRNRSLSRADANVVLGARMAERVRGFGVAWDKVGIIANWADGELVRPLAVADNPLRAEWNLTDRFIAGYSGNLGRAHETEMMLDAMERTRSARIGWLFIGGGVGFEALKAEVSARGLDLVQLRPYQPRERLSQSLSCIDLHLVSLRSELEGLIVPSKFHGIAAAGRPTVFIGDQDGEIARILARHECGVTVGAGEDLAAVVIGLAGDPERCARMGRNARAAFEREFDKPLAVARWEALLRELGLVPGVQVS